jgi:hypothetical protein
MSFRIGRKFAQHTYPESRGIGGLPFARNSAQGPADQTIISTTAPGTAIPWSILEVGSPGIDVPITPKVTGLLLILVMINIENLDPSIAQVVFVSQVKVGSMLVTQFETSQVIAPSNTIGGGFGSMEWSLVVQSPSPIGTTVNVEVFCQASAPGEGTLGHAVYPGFAGSTACSIDIQEVSAPTG